MTDKPTTGATITGRLAPSPTGVLHLGNARSFLLAWLSLRSRNGRVLLRIEDIDSPRVVPEAEASAIHDLEWLGLDWDGLPLRQSDRLHEYEACANELIRMGLAYPCICTRKDVEEAASAPHDDSHEGMVYPGTCRGRWTSREEALAETGRPAALRFRTVDTHVPFTDLFAGDQDGFSGGDFVIMKKDGGPAYQLAVVVDDHDQGVTEVLRADDLLPSTPRQLLLYRAFGWEPPSFTHVPLVVGHDDYRLAKRHGDTSLAHLRDEGVTAERIVGLLAWSCGLKDEPTPCCPADLVEDFELKRLPPQPFRFDENMLRC